MPSTSLAKTRRDAAGHRWTAAPPATITLLASRQARPRCGDPRPSSGRRGAAEGQSHWSIRTAPTIFRGWVIYAPPGLCSSTLVALTRELRGRRFFNSARPAPDLLIDAAIWLRSAPWPTWCRCKGLNRAFVAKGLIALAPARTDRLDRLDGRGAAERSAGGVSSRLPARAAHQCRRPHRPRRSRRAADAGGRHDRGRTHRR